MKINVTSSYAQQPATIPDDAIVVGTQSTNTSYGTNHYVFWYVPEGTGTCGHTINMDSFLDDVVKLVDLTLAIDKGYFKMPLTDTERDLVQSVSIASQELRK